MKLTSRASLAFKLPKPATKPAFGSNVINALSALVPAKKGAQANFSNLPVPVSDLQTINDDLSAAIADALTGNHAAVATVKNAVAEWNNAFTLTANYVSSVAAGDETIIRSAGFVPTKSESTPAQKPGAATSFKATINGSKGAIIAGSKSAVPDAKAYVYSAVPEGVTVSYNGNTMVITVGDKSIYVIADTQKQTEFFNMPSCVPYNVSMFAINSAGSGPAAASQQVVPQ